MNIIKSLITLFFSILINGCATQYDIETNSSKEKYSDTLSFNTPLKEVRAGVLNSLAIKYQIERPIELRFDTSNILAVETKDNSSFCNEIFDIPDNQHDICLNKFGWYWYSENYVVNGEAAKTTGRFHIHFEEISETRTKVIVNILGLKVINGLECCGSHGRYARLTSVAPTGEEEYAILKHIGSYFNVTIPN